MVVAFVVALSVAACADSTDDTTSTSIDAPTTSPLVTTSSSSTTSSEAPTTSSEATTTTAARDTTTTSAATTAGFHPVPPIPLVPPEAIPGSAGASGSGCAPGSDDLPDGIWFVFMLEKLPNAVRGDLACFWFGDIAYEVGEAAGDEVADDFYISNESNRIRTVPIASGAAVWVIAGDTTEGHSAIPFGDWPSDESTYVQCPGDFCTVWLYVNDGVVTDIVEQYIP